jgi:hypothetical protein
MASITYLFSDSSSHCHRRSRYVIFIVRFLYIVTKPMFNCFCSDLSEDVQSLQRQNTDLSEDVQRLGRQNTDIMVSLQAMISAEKSRNTGFTFLHFLTTVT